MFRLQSLKYLHTIYKTVYWSHSSAYSLLEDGTFTWKVCPIIIAPLIFILYMKFHPAFILWLRHWLPTSSCIRVNTSCSCNICVGSPGTFILILLQLCTNRESVWVAVLHLLPTHIDPEMMSVWSVCDHSPYSYGSHFPLMSHVSKLSSN